MICVIKASTDWLYGPSVDRWCVLPKWLLKSKLVTLEVQIYRFIATDVYKAVNKLSPIYIQELFDIKDLIYNFCPIRTKVPKCSSVTYDLKSLRFLGNKTWNSIPIYIKMS